MRVSDENQKIQKRRSLFLHGELIKLSCERVLLRKRNVELARLEFGRNLTKRSERARKTLKHKPWKVA